jgi:hypothetical protein
MEISLLGIIILLIIIGIIFWAARALIAAFSIPQPIATVIYVILVLVVLLYLLNQIGVGPAIRVR